MTLPDRYTHTFTKWHNIFTVNIGISHIILFDTLWVINELLHDISTHIPSIIIRQCNERKRKKTLVHFICIMHFNHLTQCRSATEWERNVYIWSILFRFVSFSFRIVFFLSVLFSIASFHLRPLSDSPYSKRQSQVLPFSTISFKLYRSYLQFQFRLYYFVVDATNANSSNKTEWSRWFVDDVSLEPRV